jgi:molybdopterin-guanine dinucleotide biosynthesis adapter protein
MKIFGIAGYSGSGKTTLLERVIPLLVDRGLRVSVVKHAHHAFDVDKPGKDSYRHRSAGATEVLISSAARWALMHELRQQGEPELPQLLARLSDCDLVLVEGFKRQPIPKLEIHRAAANTPTLFPQDPTIVAIASDRDLETRLPVFGLDDHAAIADYIVAHALPADGFTRR